MFRPNDISVSDETDYYCIIDPGTTSLRVLAVEVSSGEATVWGWAERQRPGGRTGRPSKHAAGVEDALARAEAMAEDQAGEWFRAENLLVGLPASLLRGHAWSLVQRRARPEIAVQERELKALLARALRLAMNQLRGPEEIDWLLVDATVVALSVDGRGVTDPVGFRATELGATVSAVLAQAELVNTWKQTATTHGFSTLILVATPMALTACRSASESLLLDVGGKTTDLIWSRSGQPVAINSLPIGGEAMTKALLRRWDLSLDKAEQLKRAYSGGELADQARAQVRQAMTPALEAWLEATETTLAQLQESAEKALPDSVYLLGGGSALPDFVETACALAWSRRLTFARYPQIGRLRAQDVGGVVNRTELGHEAGDTPALALAAWAAALARVPDRPARILSELCEVQRA